MTRVLYYVALSFAWIAASRWVGRALRTLMGGN